MRIVRASAIGKLDNKNVVLNFCRDVLRVNFIRVLFMTVKSDKSFRYNSVMSKERYRDPVLIENNVPITKRPLGISRRNFLAFGSTAALTFATAPNIYQKWPRYEGEESSPEDETIESTAEEVEVEVEVATASSEAFKQDVEKYKMLGTLDRTSVFFTNEQGAIVGDVILFSDFVEQRGTRINRDGVEEPFFYLLTPAAKDDETNEYLVDTIPPEWSKHLTAEYAKSLRMDPKMLTLQHVTAEFVSALGQKDEPELIAGIVQGTIRTKVDLVRYFSEKDFFGSGGEDRFEYIKNHLTFSGNLAKATKMTHLLRRLIPCLCAVESGFDNKVVNKTTGAKGSFQFMRDTWEDELKRPAFMKDKELPFTEQVDAVGELFSKAYDRLKYWCYEEENYQGRNYLEDIKMLFDTQDDFENYFLGPCLLGTHNTGERGMGEVVVAYAQSVPFHTRAKKGNQNGFDVFQEMTQWARASDLVQLKDYKNDASSYVQKIYAFAELVDEGALASGDRVAQL